MVEIKSLRAIILILFLISLFHLPKASSKPSGFSLKLIRAYSPMSSHSHKNNTFLERYKSYAQASKARASFWTSFHKSTTEKTIHPNVIQPPLKKEERRIVVLMMIGTPAQQVFLEFDTGSFYSWTQCASCTTCFPQSTAKFDPQRSRTYREMSSNDSNCDSRIYFRNEHQCLYRTKYIAEQYSKGIVFSETFEDTDPFEDVVRDIRFGCSLEAVGFGYPPDTIISGVLGMSRAKESLPRQLSQIGGNGRFSYCLVDINTTPSVVNKVTFGDDIPIIPGEHLSRVPFIQHRYSRHAWAINLVDISVGNERLYLPPGVFAPYPNGGNGGLILDTGSPFTFINRLVYRVIKSKIQNYLSRRLDFTQIDGPYDLCYSYYRPRGQLPTDYLQTITFHLVNQVDLVMPVTSVYFFNREEKTFCLGILGAETHWPNILGSLAQQDKRFIYDHDQDSLFFKLEVVLDRLDFQFY